MAGSTTLLLLPLLVNSTKILLLLLSLFFVLSLLLNTTFFFSLCETNFERDTETESEAQYKSLKSSQISRSFLIITTILNPLINKIITKFQKRNKTHISQSQSPLSDSSISISKKTIHDLLSDSLGAWTVLIHLHRSQRSDFLLPPSLSHTNSHAPHTLSLFINYTKKKLITHCTHGYQHHHHHHHHLCSAQLC